MTEQELIKISALMTVLPIIILLITFANLGSEASGWKDPKHYWILNCVFTALMAIGLWLLGAYPVFNILFVYLVYVIIVKKILYTWVKGN